MATALHNLSEYDFTKIPDASNMCFGIVVAEWNPEITGALLDGAVKTLEKHGALTENIHVKTVPGSFELIYGAHQMVLNGNLFNRKLAFKLWNAAKLLQIYSILFNY